MCEKYYFLKLLYYRIYKGNDIMYVYYDGKTFVAVLQDFVKTIDDCDLVCVLSWFLIEQPIIAFQNLCGLFGFTLEDFINE